MHPSWYFTQFTADWQLSRVERRYVLHDVSHIMNLWTIIHFVARGLVKVWMYPKHHKRRYESSSTDTTCYIYHKKVKGSVVLVVCTKNIDGDHHNIMSTTTLQYMWWTATVTIPSSIHPTNNKNNPWSPILIYCNDTFTTLWTSVIQEKLYWSTCYPLPSLALHSSIPLFQKLDGQGLGLYGHMFYTYYIIL